jgi:hypothetical protein
MLVSLLRPTELCDYLLLGYSSRSPLRHCFRSSFLHGKCNSSRDCQITVGVASAPFSAHCGPSRARKSDIPGKNTLPIASAARPQSVNIRNICRPFKVCSREYGLLRHTPFETMLYYSRRPRTTPFITSNNELSCCLAGSTLCSFADLVFEQKLEQLKPIHAVYSVFMLSMSS